MIRRQNKTSRPTKPENYPLGTFVETEKGWYYIASPSKRYKIITKRILDSWAPARVVRSSEAACAKYRVAAKLQFRNGSLIHSVADGKIYLIVQTKRRHVQSPEVFERIGAVGNRSDVTSVSLEEILLHEEGAPLI